MKLFAHSDYSSKSIKHANGTTTSRVSLTLIQQIHLFQSIAGLTPWCLSAGGGGEGEWGEEDNDHN